MRCHCGGDVVSRCLNCRPGPYTSATQPRPDHPRLRRRRQFPSEWTPGLGWRSHHEVTARKGRPGRGGREPDNQEPRKTAEPGSRLLPCGPTLVVSRAACGPACGGRAQGLRPGAIAGPAAPSGAALMASWSPPWQHCASASWMRAAAGAAYRSGLAGSLKMSTPAATPASQSTVAAIRSAQVYGKASSPLPSPRPKNTTIVRRQKNATKAGRAH
jgi:hypothetical protein